MEHLTQPRLRLRRHRPRALQPGPRRLTEPIDDLDGLFLERRRILRLAPGHAAGAGPPADPVHGRPGDAGRPDLAVLLPQLPEGDRPAVPFYIRENFYPLRAEYNEYCQWVAGQLASVRFGTDVTGEITYDDGVYTARRWTARRGPEVLRARRLVLGTGTPPYVPEACAGLLAAGGPVLHNSDYLEEERAAAASGASPSSAAARARRRSTTTCCRTSTSTATSSTGSPAPAGSSRWSTPSSPWR